MVGVAVGNIGRDCAVRWILEWVSVLRTESAVRGVMECVEQI